MFHWKYLLGLLGVLSFKNSRFSTFTRDVCDPTGVCYTKNILQNDVVSDFVFILKMRKNPRNFGSQSDCDRCGVHMCLPYKCVFSHQTICPFSACLCASFSWPCSARMSPVQMRQFPTRPFVPFSTLPLCLFFMTICALQRPAFVPLLHGMFECDCNVPIWGLGYGSCA